jgi:hypothetical protein
VCLPARVSGQSRRPSGKARLPPLEGCVRGGRSVTLGPRAPCGRPRLVGGWPQAFSALPPALPQRPVHSNVLNGHVRGQTPDRSLSDVLALRSGLWNGSGDSAGAEGDHAGGLDGPSPADRLGDAALLQGLLERLEDVDDRGAFPPARDRLR